MFAQASALQAMVHEEDSGTSSHAIWSSSCHYSVADRGSEEVLEYCEKEEMGFIPYLCGPVETENHDVACVARIYEKLRGVGGHREWT
jgi:hypothetical protein